METTRKMPLLHLRFRLRPLGLLLAALQCCSVALVGAQFGPFGPGPQQGGPQGAGLDPASLAAQYGGQFQNPFAQLAPQQQQQQQAQAAGQLYGQQGPYNPYGLGAQSSANPFLSGGQSAAQQQQFPSGQQTGPQQLPPQLQAAILQQIQSQLGQQQQQPQQAGSQASPQEGPLNPFAAAAAGGGNPFSGLGPFQGAEGGQSGQHAASPFGGPSGNPFSSSPLFSPFAGSQPQPQPQQQPQSGSLFGAARPNGDGSAAGSGGPSALAIAQLQQLIQQQQQQQGGHSQPQPQSQFNPFGGFNPFAGPAGSSAAPASHRETSSPLSQFNPLQQQQQQQLFQPSGQQQFPQSVLAGNQQQQAQASQDQSLAALQQLIQQQFAAQARSQPAQFPSVPAADQFQLQSAQERAHNGAPNTLTSGVSYANEAPSHSPSSSPSTSSDHNAESIRRQIAEMIAASQPQQSLPVQQYQPPPQQQFDSAQRFGHAPSPAASGPPALQQQAPPLPQQGQGEPYISWGRCPQFEPTEAEKRSKGAILTKCLRSTPLQGDERNVTEEAVEVHRAAVATCALREEGWFNERNEYRFDKAEREIREKRLEPRIEREVLEHHARCGGEAKSRFSGSLIPQIQLYQACMDYHISEVCGIIVGVRPAQPQPPQPPRPQAPQDQNDLFDAQRSPARGRGLGPGHRNAAGRGGSSGSGGGLFG